MSLLNALLCGGASLAALALTSQTAFADATSDTAGSASAPPHVEQVTVTARHLNVGTKSDTPLQETAATIDVVPRETIEQQAASRVKDVLENVAGITPGTTLGSGTGYYIRGFKDVRIYRNGMLVNGGNDSFDSDLGTANIESLSVLKGPGSVLYGRVEPGGVINIETKRPLSDPHLIAQQSVGSYNFKRSEVDATGPLLGDHNLLYRVAGSYEDADSFRKFVSHQETLFAPSLTWRPSDRFDGTIEGEFYKKDFDADFGIPAVGNRPAPIPISENLGDPNTPRSHLNKTHIGSEIHFHLNSDWVLTNRFLYSKIKNNETFLNPAPAFGTTALLSDGTYKRNAFFEGASQEFKQTTLDLNGHVEFAGAKHEILAGIDYLNGTTDYEIHGNYKTSDPALNINIYSPTYGVPASVIATDLLHVASTRPYSHYAGEWYGAYVQDQITVWNRLHLLAGGRYDWASGGRGRGASFAIAYANEPTVENKDKRFSPHLGLAYDVTPDLTLYSSWTNSFAHSNGLDPVTGARRPPEIGEQYEAGAKAALLDRRLNATFAVYNLTKDNVAEPNPADPLTTILRGQQRSRGVELSVSGQLTPTLSFNGGYAYTDAIISKDTSGLQGNRIANVPKNQANFWAKYDVTTVRNLRGLSLALGVFYVGERAGDADQPGGSTFQLPAYTRLDAAAYYQFTVYGRHMTAQLNVKNLTDKRYYDSTDEGANVGSRYGVYPGAPRTIYGSLRVAF